MIVRPRKLLAAAALAGLTACGAHRPAAPVRVDHAAPPVVAAATSGSVDLVAVADAELAAPPAPAVAAEATAPPGPAPEPVAAPAARPRCDANGRPLAGNVAPTKASPRACTDEQLLAAGLAP